MKIRWRIIFMNRLGWLGRLFQAAPLGVFGKTVADDYVLQAGERVEIYRPLLIDPKENRRRRAAGG